MKKSSSIVIIVIVLLVAAGGALALLHKSHKSSPNSSSSSSSANLPSVDNAVLVTKTSSTLGKYLAEPNGQALYTYASDTSGVSNCSGSCLASWPAYQDKGATTGLPAGVSTIKRSDNGQIQYTYNGMPLYTFVNDSNGQVTGNGVSNFTIAKPAAASSSSSSTSNATSAGSQSTSAGSTTNSTSNSSSSGGYNY